MVRFRIEVLDPYLRNRGIGPLSDTEISDLFYTQYKGRYYLGNITFDNESDYNWFIMKYC